MEQVKMHINNRQIFIRNLRTFCFVGVYDHEKTAPQELIINTRVWVPDHPVAEDKLINVLDYDILRSGILHITQNGHTHLIETLCQHIIDYCLSLDTVVAAQVKIEKTQAHADCDSVGVEMYRNK